MATTINTNLMFSVNRYQPVKDIAEASKSGHATNVIMGISVGLESTCLPVLIMCASILGTRLALLVLLLGTATGYCYWVLLLGTATGYRSTFKKSQHHFWAPVLIQTSFLLSL